MVKKQDKGISLDDAFAGDENIEYAKLKPKKQITAQKIKPTDAEEKTEIKATKPIASIKKGDKIKIDALTLEVDSHYVLINHGATKEMAIECFNPKTDKDYQIRYFSDQLQTSIEVYELDEIIYNRINVKKIEW